MNPNKTISRRLFLSQTTAIAAALLLPDRVHAQSELFTHTVRGPLNTSQMGFTLTHEHILVDFAGASTWSRSRYNAGEVFDVSLPYLRELKATGCTSFVDCSPNYLGRDPLLLAKLSEASGLHIITNTGYYGAMQERFVPKHAYSESAEQIARRWIDEFNNGIEGSGVKPGFIKTSTDTAPLTAMQRKLIQAAALTHLETGLTMLVHTGNGAAAREQLAILKEVGVANEARVWTHAQNEKDENQFVEAGKENCWVSFDGVNPDSIDRHVRYLEVMKSADLLHRVLVSHDSGWYNIGEPKGGNYKPYTCIATPFIPKLKEQGFRDAEIDRIFRVNPAEAFAIRVRKR